MALAYQIFSSPLGEVLVAGSGYAVSYVRLGDDKYLLSAEFRLDHADASPIDASGYIREACDAIRLFLNGKAKQIEIAVQAAGTDFERQVWQELRKIPYGRTKSYSEIAESIGAPNAFRAVANACGSNPVPFIIPCHRAIHKNGDMRGFGLGDDAKRFLLALEKSGALRPSSSNLRT